MANEAKKNIMQLAISGNGADLLRGIAEMIDKNIVLLDGVDLSVTADEMVVGFKLLDDGQSLSRRSHK